MSKARTREARCIVCDQPLTTDSHDGLWDHVHAPDSRHPAIPDPYTITFPLTDTGNPNDFNRA